ncbi:hypothetical protein [Corynebacterium jeikeium]|uniref:hypothetical protein n=1 Tax=Corynebacterium jeikeium TaxID=38289 RepID=UPI001E3D142E|nr:hypothetical protein [Corynebacterium jeikeium]
MQNKPHLPASAAWYGLGEQQYIQAMNTAVTIAIRVGAAFTPEHLVAIAQAARLPQNCELLDSPARLYEEALRYAHSSIWPVSLNGYDNPEMDSSPVREMRKFVAATYTRFATHPDAVRLIVAENLLGDPELVHRIGVLEDSPVVLHLDRVLMRGHDIGSFRNGVSAEDTYALITALCSFAVTQGPTFHSLYGMDPTAPDNEDGLRNLTCDAVIAFLTTTMPTDQGASYTHASHSSVIGSSVAASLYHHARHEDEEVDDAPSAPSDLYQD